MAIEIKELSIKVEVSSSKQTATLQKKELDKLKAQLRQEIVGECVDRVLEILENQSKR